MLYGYDLVQIEEGSVRNNKRKYIIILIILIVIAIVLVGGFFGMQFINQKNNENQDVNQKIEEKEDKEAEVIAIENSSKDSVKAESFTEEQMQAIENIYNSEEKRVFLTFDDGPNMSVTPYILDLLKKENIKATFFVLGNRAVYNPELIQREYNEGHYIANHGYSHVYRDIYQNVDTVFEEYNQTEQIIQDALGSQEYHSKLFRFPGGSTGGYYSSIKAEAVEELRNNGIASIDWNALSRDAEGANTVEDLVNNVIETVGDKQSVVILMHDASDKILTYEALPQIIQYLRENGYTFKNIYDIL